MLFLDLSQALMTILADAPTVQIERLSFEASEQALRLRLIYPDFETASRVEALFEQDGRTLFVSGGVREQTGQFIGDANLSFTSGGSRS